MCIIYQSLLAFYGQAPTHLQGLFHMDDQESETKFDALVKVEQIWLDSHSLTQVPSMKNMGELRSFKVPANKITRIVPGDFRGATQLVILSLAGNRITSVAPEAFSHLNAIRVLPNAFKPKNRDKSPFTDSRGTGSGSLSACVVCVLLQLSVTFFFFFLGYQYGRPSS